MFGPRVQVGPPGTTPHRHGERASKLSGGQQQRVALARAFVFSPAVLLFDEPLSNLDAKLRAEMRLEIKELQHKLGITSVYVTHDLEEALAISDRIVVMRNGIIEQIGGPADIYYGTAFGRSVGADGVFSVRTIHMRLSHERSAGELNAWPVKVRRHVFQGDFTQYHVDWEDRQLVVRSSATEQPEDMKEAYLTVDPRHCVLLES